MNKKPIDAVIVSIRATAQEAKELRTELKNKTSIIKEAGVKPLSEVTPPSGPMFINGQWWV
tara:strand:- start:727 stop:909 length:183 start_codon:yes stop_codon:yes gene_type:complete